VEENESGERAEIRRNAAGMQEGVMKRQKKTMGLK